MMFSVNLLTFEKVQCYYRVLGQWKCDCYGSDGWHGAIGLRRSKLLECQIPQIIQSVYCLHLWALCLPCSTFPDSDTQESRQKHCVVCDWGMHHLLGRRVWWPSGFVEWDGGQYGWDCGNWTARAWYCSLVGIWWLSDSDCLREVGSGPLVLMGIGRLGGIPVLLWGNWWPKQVIGIVAISKLLYHLFMVWGGEWVFQRERVSCIDVGCWNWS